MVPNLITNEAKLKKNDNQNTLSMISGETYGPKDTRLVEDTMIGTSDFGVCNTIGDGMAAFIAASIAFEATEGVSIDDFEVKSTKRKEK